VGADRCHRDCDGSAVPKALQTLLLKHLVDAKCCIVVRAALVVCHGSASIEINLKALATKESISWFPRCLWTSISLDEHIWEVGQIFLRSRAELEEVEEEIRKHRRAECDPDLTRLRNAHADLYLC